jgi:hypothetical protein
MCKFTASILCFILLFALSLDVSLAAQVFYDKSIGATVSAPINQIAHRRAHSRRTKPSDGGNETSDDQRYNNYNGFGTGGTMTPADDFAFGGYDPDVAIQYRDGVNVSGPYGYDLGFGPGWGGGFGTGGGGGFGPGGGSGFSPRWGGGFGIW